MKKKSLPLLAAVGILSAIAWYADLNTLESSSLVAPDEPNTSSSPLEYTKHARCRMGCRHISESEVLQIVSHGTVNLKKSNPQATPCPVKAVEGTTGDQQTVRVVYGECGRQKKIITVIDLKNDYVCDCE